LAIVHNPAEAVKYLPETDLMYLDINMPKVSGIDFLRQISNPPLTILTTAYQQYALEGYALDVVDYLLKPISFPRFLKATGKAIDYLKLLRNEKAEPQITATREYFFVKSNGVLEKIVLSEIQAIEALANYIIIHCIDKKVIAYLTLKQIQAYLPDNAFIKVHKSFIAAIDQIERIDHNEIVLGKLRIPIGVNFKEDVTRLLVSGKILKR
jgi:DNA-binding LytR/AlgR family response regulator